IERLNQNITGSLPLPVNTDRCTNSIWVDLENDRGCNQRLHLEDNSFMNKMFRVFLTGMFLLICGGMSLIYASQSTPESLTTSYNITFPIQLRDNVSVQIGATVLTNPRNPHFGAQILFLNGTAQTAATFRPLAQAIFSDTFGFLVSKAILLDYPGH